MTVSQKLVAVAILLGFSVSAMAAGKPTADEQVIEGTRGYRDEIHRPPEPYKGPPRTGAQVYAYRCAGCHAKTTQGAPMPGDDIEWGLRARQGMKVLMEHTVNGYKQLLMPPRGGCGNCSDEELKAAIVYMLKESGIEPPT
jgi:cytochrome c5